MNIQLKAGSPTALSADAVVLGLYEDDKKLGNEAQVLDEASSGRIRAMLDLGDFKPELNDTATVFGGGKVKRIVLVGLGKRADLTADRVRQAMGSAIRVAASLKAKRVAVAGFSLESDRKLVQSLVEGAELGAYTFNDFRGKGSDGPDPEVDHLTILLPKVTRDAEAGLDTGVVLSEAVNWVRDLVNRPGASLTATDLANEAKAMAKPRGLTCKVLGKKELEAQGFGCLLAVNAGSTQPPAFIIVEYMGGKKGEKPIALVGKGITFDTGGLCIKPAGGMEEMKTDMAGAGAVLGAIRALSDLKAPVNVVGLISSTDNMPNSGAYKPGDVLKSYSGLTVEVIDTDAEGRIVLSDALAYADRHYHPKATIDLATLTGSIIVALGMHVTGLFSNDQDLSDRLYQAGQASGEKVWPMPLWDVYEDMVASDIADVKNADKRRGDAIGAAKFLEKFVGERPWAHLDIAGPSWIEDGRPYEPKGASGHGVRLLVELLNP